MEHDGGWLDTYRKGGPLHPTANSSAKPTVRKRQVSCGCPSRQGGVATSVPEPFSWSARCWSLQTFQSFYAPSEGRATDNTHHMVMAVCLTSSGVKLPPSSFTIFCCGGAPSEAWGGLWKRNRRQVGLRCAADSQSTDVAVAVSLSAA